MALRIVHGDVAKMNTDAIVDAANALCKKEKAGRALEGDAFIAPGIEAQAKYVINAVSPKYQGGGEGEEDKLRSCYAKSLQLAADLGIRSMAFPLLSAGSLGYPREEAMRVAVDEINAFMTGHEMDVLLVVGDENANSVGERIRPGLEEYLSRNYVEEIPSVPADEEKPKKKNRWLPGREYRVRMLSVEKWKASEAPAKEVTFSAEEMKVLEAPAYAAEEGFLDFEGIHESRLEERMKHVTDTFSQYLMYLIREKKMENAEVYKRAIVDKKIFSKIKNNVDYHPQKLTALCLCVGAKLNLDESKDLLARAGYALSPCDKTDIIFSYFIENEIYDMIELDIQLEEHGLPCIIS